MAARVIRNVLVLSRSPTEPVRAYSWPMRKANNLILLRRCRDYIFRRWIGTSSVCLQKHVEDEEKRLPRPRRAMMYVPASDERKIRKIPTLGADTVVLDCEDGVAVNQKVCGRGLVGSTTGVNVLPYCDLSLSLPPQSLHLCPYFRSKLVEIFQELSILLVIV